MEKRYGKGLESVVTSFANNFWVLSDERGDSACAHEPIGGCGALHILCHAVRNDGDVPVCDCRAIFLFRTASDDEIGMPNQS